MDTRSFFDPASRLREKNQSPDYRTLIDLFDHCFFAEFQTRLIAHAHEPLYLPATGTQPARIYFAHDYCASAFHEVAHWCIAGEQRRQREDYGYWYAPDGRTEQQQRLFEQVEVQPQAMEWIFSRCSSAPFHISADNLNGQTGCSETFKDNVYQQVLSYLVQGLPARANRFARALAGFYRNGRFPDAGEFSRTTL